VLAGQISTQMREGMTSGSRQPSRYVWTERRVREHLVVPNNRVTDELIRDMARGLQVERAIYLLRTAAGIRLTSRPARAVGWTPARL
jgi:hypothetical protein